jgi:hypothetical protein
MPGDVLLQVPHQGPATAAAVADAGGDGEQLADALVREAERTADLAERFALGPQVGGSFDRVHFEDPSV